MLKTPSKNKTNRNFCNGRGCIAPDTFIPHMQTTTMDITMEEGENFPDTGQILLCGLEKLGCETTSLDAYAFIRDYPNNCALSGLQTEVVKMIELNKTFNVISEAYSDSKFVFEVDNNSQKLCGELFLHGLKKFRV